LSLAERENEKDFRREQRVAFERERNREKESPAKSYIRSNVKNQRECPSEKERQNRLTRKSRRSRGLSIAGEI